MIRLLQSGLALSDLVCDLAEGLPRDAYPGEEPTEVVLEMLCGTVTAALEPVDPEELRRAIELIELAHDQTIEHLQLALAVGRRIRGEDGTGGPSYG